MFRRRVTTDDIYSMEDSEYRDLMRQDLARARRSQRKQSSVAGTIVLSLLLAAATTAVIMHHLGMIQMPK